MSYAKKIGRLFLISLFTTPLLSVVSMLWYNNTSIKDWKARHDILNRYKPQIMSDLKTIENEKFFDVGAFKNDGTQFLEKIIPVIGDIESSIHSNEETGLARSILSSHTQWHRNKEGLQALINDTRWKTLNFTWLNELERFDYISLLSLNKNKENLEQIRNLNLIDKMMKLTVMSYFDFDSLHAWALLNWLDQTQKGRYTTGLKTYKKVKNLIQTAGSIEAQEIAIGMVVIENLVPKFLGLPASHSHSDESIASFRRVLRFWPQLIQESFFYDRPTGFEPYYSSQYGICSLAWVTPKSHFIFRDLLQPTWLLEKSLEKNFARSQNLFQAISDKCGLADYLPIILFSPSSGHKWPPQDEAMKVATEWRALPEIDFHNFFKILGRVPLIRKTVALKMENMLAYDGLKGYVEAEPTTSQ